MYKNKPFALIGFWILLASFFSPMAAQTNKGYEYSVTVTDPSNQPLIGVNVYTDGMKFTGVTDLDGKITLKDIGYSEVVHFSYVGYGQLDLPFFKIRQQGGVVQMNQSIDLLPTVVVIGRRDEAPREIPYTVSVIDKRQIAFLNPQTTADALAQNENVFVQKSQMAGGSINIRGFEANKVLLVLDGVRMNNIVYRAGHLQDAIKVDPNILEQIEVIYGPGSLNYGSDALGGVVQFRTRDPKLMDKEEFPGKTHHTNTNLFIRYASANQEKSIHGDVNYGTEKWGSLTSLTFTDYGDMRAGANRPDEYPDFGARRRYVVREEEDIIFTTRDTNIQSPTGYSQFDFMQKIKFQPNRNQSFIFNLQYSNTTDVPRYDFLTNTTRSGDFEFSEWYYGPQQRILASVKSQTFKNTALFNKFTAIASFQKLDEDRYIRNLGKAWRQFTLDDIYALSATLDFDKNLFRQLKLIYGVDANFDKLYSDAGQINVETQKRAGGIPSRYPNGGSDLTTLAGYTNLKWQTADSVLTVFGGLRYTWTQLFSIFEDRADDPIIWPTYFYTEGLSTTNSALTWSAGFVLQSNNGWQLKGSGSTAFHAPNVDDFAKFRARNNFLTIPNPGLKPEHAITGELTVAKDFGQRNGSAGLGGRVNFTGYYTMLEDGIVRMPFQLPNGDITIFNDADGFFYRVEANQNVSKATIRGGSANLSLHFAKHWEFLSSGDFSWGRIDDPEVDGGLPMDHIPPFFGKTGINFKTEKVKLSFTVRYQAAKPVAEYADGEDNLEYATEDGTYAWTTFNFNGSYKFTKNFTFDLAFENMTDLHYRPFSSGVSAAGRNFIFALRGSF